MASRNVPTSSSPPPIQGPVLLNTYAARFLTLFNAISLVPTNIVNSGDDYTITIDPPLEADVINGMSFYITPNVTNPSGAARIRVTASNPYYKWAKFDGSDLDAGELDPATTYHVVFVGGEFRMTSFLPGEAVDAFVNRQVFDSSDTWNKPTGSTFGPNSVVLVRDWGAGGGGTLGFGVGGGGGGYSERWMLLGDLASTETVTIGAGGTGSATPGAGGNSTFGSHLTAYGGGALSGKKVTGAAGGGPLSAASSTTPGSPLIASQDPSVGASLINFLGSPGNDSLHGFDGIYHGGGPGTGSTTECNGGNSLYGGGGGAGNTASVAGTGGTSVNGGDGGDAGVNGANGEAGQQPGGGGGSAEDTGGATAGDGGDGRVEVIVWAIAA